MPRLLLRNALKELSDQGLHCLSKYFSYRTKIIDIQISKNFMSVKLDSMTRMYFKVLLAVKAISVK